MTLEDRVGGVVSKYVLDYMFAEDLTHLTDAIHDLAREVYEEGFGKGYAAAVAEENFDEALEGAWNEYS